MIHSCGTLLYKYVDGVLYVLLVHASGNYNKNQPWSIPKGEVDLEDDYEQTARRETLEEVGVVCDKLSFLASCIYSSKKKTVHCFAGKMPNEQEAKVASWEIDRVEFFMLDEAIKIIHKDQKLFITKLIERLKK